MPHLAPHIPAVPGSGIRRIFQLAQQSDGITYPVVGEPDATVAPHIAAAAKRAWDDDLTDYTDTAGIVPLRAAIVEKLARENSTRATVDQMWVTVATFTMSARTLGTVLSPPAAFSSVPEKAGRVCLAAKAEDLLTGLGRLPAPAVAA